MMAANCSEVILMAVGNVLDDDLRRIQRFLMLTVCGFLGSLFANRVLVLIMILST